MKKLFCLTGLLLISTAAGAADWPMLGQNPARSGWAAETLEGPTERKWYRSFVNEGLLGGVQPVVMDETLFIGTMAGRLYALHAGTGEERWTRDAGAPILHTAAVDQKRVYVGTAAGELVALDVKDGRPVWRYQTGQAVWNAPVLIDDVIYFGSRDGGFYALQATDGELIWRTELDGPVLCSPAADSEAVYVASEGMHAYALNRADGSIRWRNKLYGISARGYHPVVSDGVVYFTTQPGLGKYGPVDVLLEACRKLGLQPRQRIGADPRGYEEPREVYRAKDRHDEPLLRDPDLLVQLQIEVLKIQIKKPHTRSLFAFDTRTGQEPWMVPLCWQESCGGPGNPPVVAPDGRVFLKYATASWARRGDYAPYLRLGELDKTTGRIRSVMDDMEHSKSPMWGMTHDEMARLTGMGTDTVIHAREGYPGFRGVVALDLNSHERTPLADNIHFGARSIGPRNLLRLHRDEPLEPSFEYIPRGAGVFGGAGTYAAVVVANDMLYYVPGHEGRSSCTLIAWGPAGEPFEWRDPLAEPDDPELTDKELDTLQAMPLDWDMLLPPYGRCWPRDSSVIPPEPPEVFDARSASAHAYAEQLTAEDLEVYLATPSERENEIIRADAALCDAVEELFADDWAPLPFPDLMFGGEYYFDDPLEIYTVLAGAYPYLSRELQVKAKRYMERHSRRYAPYQTDRLPAGAGRRRTLYELPFYAHIKPGPVRAMGVERLYPLWQWAHASGDWSLLERDWTPLIRERLSWAGADISGKDLLWNNALLSGVIAYWRIAEYVQDKEALAESRTLALDLIRRRIAAEKTYTKTRFLSRRPRLAGPERYRYLTPEIGRMVADHAPAAAQQLYDRYIAHHRPLWYLAWGPLQYEHWETSIERPINARAVFAARTWLFEDNPEQLADRLDLPWSRADLYYIHKRAMLAAARQTTVSGPGVTKPPR